MLHDFKLILRDPTDRGMKRSKPTPSASGIEKNIDNFLIQWKSVEYEGTKVIPPSAINEIEKLLVHVRKGCLSDIPPSGGTSRNEGIHKVLNKTLRKSRIGIQFALALLGIFFYIWNEKKITATKDQRRIRVTPPIESHFEQLESNQEQTGNHHFGITDQDVVLPKTGDFGLASYCSDHGQENTHGEIVEQLNNFLDGVSSNISSDEDEPSFTENNSPPPFPNLSKQQQQEVIKSAKCMAELCDQIQSLGQYARFNPNFLFFTKSSLTLFHSGLVSNKESSTLDNVLSNFNMVRVNVLPNGNCFFLSIAYAIVNSIIPNKAISNDLASHLESLGLMNCKDTNEMSHKLRELIVHEWISHPEDYQPFIGVGQLLDHEASLFLNDGYFASELGNCMALAMANLLSLPIVVITQMESMSVVPVTPRETLQCLPIFVAFDHSGEGHYDAVAHSTSHSVATETKSCSVNSTATDPESCRCGQGAKKRIQHHLL